MTLGRFRKSRQNRRGLEVLSRQVVVAASYSSSEHYLPAFCDFLRLTACWQVTSLEKLASWQVTAIAVTYLTMTMYSYSCKNLCVWCWSVYWLTKIAQNASNDREKWKSSGRGDEPKRGLHTQWIPTITCRLWCPFLSNGRRKTGLSPIIVPHMPESSDSVSTNTASYRAYTLRQLGLERIHPRWCIVVSCWTWCALPCRVVSDQLSCGFYYDGRCMSRKAS